MRALLDLFDEFLATFGVAEVGDDVLALARTFLVQAVRNLLELFLFARSNVDMSSVVHKSRGHHLALRGEQVSGCGAMREENARGRFRRQ